MPRTLICKFLKKEFFFFFPPRPIIPLVILLSHSCCFKVHCAHLFSTGTPSHINKVLSHPTLPITITAQEDRHIKFFDNNSGKLIHSMVAHLDAVTSLAVDPNGLYLMSGSKYLMNLPILDLIYQN